MAADSVIEAIGKYKIIAILRGVPAEKLIPLTEALYRGGIRLTELTYNAEKPSSWEENAANIARLVRRFEGRLLVGAGTVLCEEQVEMTARAGGRFIVSPDTNEKVIAKTKELGLVSVPGAFTPTEIQRAHLAGADFVKMFPAGAGGVGYFKDVKTPLAHIRLLAVGGIHPENMADYLKAGAAGFGISSGIAPASLVEDENWEGVTALARSYVLAAGLRTEKRTE